MEDVAAFMATASLASMVKSTEFSFFSMVYVKRFAFSALRSAISVV
jgi:hypothetical protein